MVPPFNQPFATQNSPNIPGGVLGQLGYQYLVGRTAAYTGHLPIRIGHSNMFDTYRGLSYDQRQIDALSAMVQPQIGQFHRNIGGAFGLAGKEYTDEMRQFTDKLMNISVPLLVSMASGSPEMRRVLSIASGGVSPINIALGMEGLSRRQFNPYTGRVGGDAAAALETTSTLAGMLRSEGQYTTRRDGSQGVRLTRGSRFGFSDLEMLSAMGEMAAYGELPSAASILNMAGDRRLSEALQDGRITDSDLTGTGKLSPVQQHLISTGQAVPEDFASVTGSGILALHELGLDSAEAIQQLMDEIAAGGGDLGGATINAINADRYAQAVEGRLAALRAVNDFLTDSQIEAFGDDLTKISDSLLRHMSGNATHQLSGRELSRRLSSISAQADRLGLRPDAMQELAGLTAQYTRQQGFQAADSTLFLNESVSAANRFADLGMGGWAGLGIATYGMDSQDEMAARFQQGYAGARRSQAANMVSAMNILSRRAGVEIDENSQIGRLLAEARTGELSQASRDLLSGGISGIAAALQQGASGISLSDFHTLMGQQFILDEEMSNNPLIAEAMARNARGDVIRVHGARAMQTDIERQMAAMGLGGTTAERAALARAFGADLAADLMDIDPELAGDISAGGNLARSRTSILRERMAQAAASGNKTAIDFMARMQGMSSEAQEDMLRNMLSSGYTSMVNELHMPMSQAVGQFGSVGEQQSAASAAYAAATAELRHFAESGHKTGAAAFVDMLETAGEDGLDPAAFLRLLGIDVTGQTLDEVEELKQRAQLEVDTIASQLKGMDPESAAPLRARQQQYLGMIAKMQEFIDSGGQVTDVSAEDREKFKKILESASVEELERWQALSGEDYSDYIEKRKEADAKASASGTGTTARIDSATVDNLAIGSLTINLGDTTITSNNATASVGGNRSSVPLG